MVTTYEVGAINASILQLREVRVKQGEELAHYHKASKNRAGVQTQLQPNLELMLLTTENKLNMFK